MSIKYPKCPGCGAGFDSPHHKRLGWHYSQCGRRWHEEHGWESYCPTGCLHRQLAQANQRYQQLATAAKKLRLCFPDDIPKADNTKEFTIPRYVVEELDAALREGDDHA